MATVYETPRVGHPSSGVVKPSAPGADRSAPVTEQPPGEPLQRSESPAEQPPAGAEQPPGRSSQIVVGVLADCFRREPLAGLAIVLSLAIAINDNRLALKQFGSITEQLTDLHREFRSSPIARFLTRAETAKNTAASRLAATKGDERRAERELAITEAVLEERIRSRADAQTAVDNQVAAPGAVPGDRPPERQPTAAERVLEERELRVTAAKNDVITWRQELAVAHAIVEERKGLFADASQGLEMLQHEFDIAVDGLLAQERVLRRDR